LWASFDRADARLVLATFAGKVAGALATLLIVGLGLLEAHLIHRYRHTPEYVLIGISCCGTVTAGSAATLVYLIADPITGECLIGNAGPPQPLLMFEPGSPHLDPADAGTPIGVPIPRQQHSSRLPSGR
jgi:hypothetical protein